VTRSKAVEDTTMMTDNNIKRETSSIEENVLDCSCSNSHNPTESLFMPVCLGKCYIATTTTTTTT
jgi:hypothetical protein